MEKTIAERPATISDEDVRGGVTGHNVRYVLGFGLGGIILSFAAVAIYFGFDRLTEMLSQAASRDPITMIRESAPYAAILLIGATAAVVLLGLWNRLSGRDQNASQTGMRIRVVTQFAVVCGIMAILYISQS